MVDRRERIILILEDRMKRGLAENAIESRRLAAALDSTGRQVEVFGRQSDGAGRQIDRLSGRLRILAEAGLAIGPALIPAGGAALTAIAGLVTQMGFAVAATGAVVTSFQGVGEALDSVNKYQLEPTAANFEAMQQAMQDLSPAGQAFVSFLDSQVQPALRELRDIGQENLFPGVQAGLDALLERAPEFSRIMAELTDTAGDIFTDFGEGLSSSAADEFFAFVEREARPALEGLAESVGNVAAGLAEMWMAFDPVSDEFSRDLVAITEDFQEWAATLADSPDFRAFMDYLIQTGPQVLDTFEALVGALGSIVTAAAPLGGPVLAALEAIARVVEAIASSDVGAPLAALAVGLGALRTGQRAIGGVTAGIAGLGTSIEKTRRSSVGLGQDLVTAVRRVPRDASAGLVAYTTALDKQTQAVGRLKQATQGLRGSAGALAGLGVAATGVADGIGLTNTASLALMGTIAGPWGVAIGAGVGALLDFKAAGEEAADAQMALVDALVQSGGELDTAVAEGLTAMLEDEGLVDWAEENGVALDELVRVIYQGEAAVDALAERLDLDPGNTFIATLRGAAEDMANMRGEAELATEVQGLLADAVARTNFSHLDRGAERLGSLGGSSDDLKTRLQELEDQTRRTDGALQALFGEASSIQGIVAYEDALDSLRESMKDAESFNPDFEKGRENLRNLAGFARDAGQQFQNLKDEGERTAAQKFLTGAIDELRVLRETAGPQGKKAIDEVLERFLRLRDVNLQGLADDVIAEFDRLKQRGRDVAAERLLTTSLADLREMRDHAGPRLRDEIQRIIDKVRAAGREKAKPEVKVDDKASPKLRDIDTLLDRMAERPPVITEVITRYHTEYSQSVDPNGPGGRGGRAAGGYITGPGGPTDDLIPAWLSNGEFVVKAKAVDHYGSDFFQRLNAMQLANGGPVGNAMQYASPASPNVNLSGPRTVSLSPRDIDRLAHAMAQIRPMFGNQHNTFYDYAQARRQFEQDDRINALAGRPQSR